MPEDELAFPLHRLFSGVPWSGCGRRMPSVPLDEAPVNW